MAQEGKIVRNKRTGELGIVQGGVVVPYNQQQGSGAVFMPNPTAAYEPQQAAANVNKTQTDIIDTAEDNRRADTQLEAELFQKGLRRNPKTGAVEYIPDWKPRESDKPATVIEKEAKEEGKRDKARVVRGIMAETLDLFKQDIDGQPISRAFGWTERFDGGPEGTDTLRSGTAERFTTTARGMLALIRPMVAMGAKDGDSDKEMLVFEAYIPKASDGDKAAEAKLRNLERLLYGVADGKLPSEAAAELSYDIPTPFVDGRLGRDRNGDPVSPVNEPRKFSPSAGPQMQQATGERYSTPQDMKVAEAVQQVYNRGGSVRDMAEAAQRLGYPVNLQNMQEWARAIDYRDAKGEYAGQNTGYATVNPPQSGKRGLMGQMYGDFAAGNSAVGDLGTMAVGAGIGASNAATLGGIDEIAGGINSVVRGTDFDDEVAYANLGKQAAFDAAPGSSMAGELLGGVGLSGMTAKLVPSALETLAGTGRRALGTGAVLGGITGALETNENRFGGAVGGTVLGAGGGVLGQKVIGPGMEAIVSSEPVQALSQKARSFANGLRPGVVAPSSLPQVSQSARTASGMLGDDIGAVRANLTEADRLGLPYSLADASPKLRSLAGSVSRRSQDARQMAEETFDPRNRDQAFRAREAIGRNLAQPVDDPKIRGGELLAGGSRAAEPYYTMANNRAAPIDEELQAFLGTQTGKDAMKEARRIAENRGEDPDALGFTVNDYGDVVLGTYPNFRTLDLIKQGIDAQIYNPANTNPVTGELIANSPTVRSLEQFRKNYVGVLDRLNPAYPKARAEYAPFAKAKEALELGLRGPSNRVAPRDLERITGGMTDQSLEEYRGGFATGLADLVDNAKLSGNPFERIYGGTSQRQKVGMLYPEGQADFRKTYDLERDMAQTRYETLGGSPTAARMAADDQFGEKALEMGADFAADLTATGGALTAGNLLKAGARGVRDMSRLGIGRQAERRADALAPILYNTDPAAAQVSLDQIEKYLSARQKRKGLFGRRAGMFGASAPVVLIPSE